MHDKIKFLEILRGPAAMLVLWDHFAGVWVDDNGFDWFPTELVRDFINTPLGIIQDFGFFGVVLFFLISGYIITHVALRESRFIFFVKRLFRIYPPLIFSLFFIFIYGIFNGIEYGFKDFISSATLLNYFKVPQNPINGVAWTLAIEMLFYLLILLFMGIYKKRPAIGTFVMVLVCSINIFLARDFGDNFFLFSVNLSFIPFLLMGQLLYFIHQKKISLAVFFSLSFFCYIVMIGGIININEKFYDSSNSYAISFVYAYLIFIALMALNEKIKESLFLKITSFLSKISYSLYLTHGTIGLIFLSYFTPKLGFSITFIVATIASIVFAYLVFILIEKPSQLFARKFLDKIKN